MAHRFLINLAGTDDQEADPNGWYVLDTARCTDEYPDGTPVPGCTGLTAETAEALRDDCEALGDDTYRA